jgi:hypothetical protein
VPSLLLVAELAEPRLATHSAHCVAWQTARTWPHMPHCLQLMHLGPLCTLPQVAHTLSQAPEAWPYLQHTSHRGVLQLLLSCPRSPHCAHVGVPPSQVNTFWLPLVAASALAAGASTPSWPVMLPSVQPLHAVRAQQQFVQLQLQQQGPRCDRPGACRVSLTDTVVIQGCPGCCWDVCRERLADLAL